MAIIEDGTGSGAKQTVTANSAGLIAFNNDATKNGIVAVAGQSDSGTKTGVILDIPPEVDADYRWRTTQDRIEFMENFAGAALNSAQWQINLTTFTNAIAGSWLKLNSGASNAANGVGRVNSYRCFQLDQGLLTNFQFPFQIAAASVGILNTVIEVGFFLATGTTAPTDGVYMTINAAGELRLVAMYNGTPVQTAAIVASTVFSPNVTAIVNLTVARGTLYLWVNDNLITSLAIPNTLPTFSQTEKLPITLRLYNGAAPPASATQLFIGPIAVSVEGTLNPYNAAELAAIRGGSNYQGQSGGTMGQTGNMVNSTAPVSATLSNTAAGYTTLGGRYQFAAVAGAETDYALFAYQVPAPALGLDNSQMLIRGVAIDIYNTVVAVAVTATIFEWAIAVGSTAVSLATAEAVTAKAPRRLPLGVQTLAIGAVVGAQANQLVAIFDSPLFAEAGTFIHIILRMPVGTATATEVFRGMVRIIGENV